MKRPTGDYSVYKFLGSFIPTPNQDNTIMESAFSVSTKNNKSTYLQHKRSYADNCKISLCEMKTLVPSGRLEEDALNVLKFMASNGLLANASKTTLLFINSAKTIYSAKLEIKKFVKTLPI